MQPEKNINKIKNNDIALIKLLLNLLQIDGLLNFIDTYKYFQKGFNPMWISKLD